MESLVIWHKKTGEILACCHRISGARVDPSIKNMFAHLPELWEELESTWVEGRYTTFQAQEAFEVVEGAVVRKGEQEPGEPGEPEEE